MYPKFRIGDKVYCQKGSIKLVGYVDGFGVTNKGCPYIIFKSKYIRVQIGGTYLKEVYYAS